MSKLRVPLHGIPLVRLQAARFFQDFERNKGLPDVMQECRHSPLGEVFLGDATLGGKSHRKDHGVGRVHVRLVIDFREGDEKGISSGVLDEHLKGLDNLLPEGSDVKGAPHADIFETLRKNSNSFIMEGIPLPESRKWKNLHLPEFWDVSVVIDGKGVVLQIGRSLGIGNGDGDILDAVVFQPQDVVGGANPEPVKENICFEPAFVDSDNLHANFQFVDGNNFVHRGLREGEGRGVLSSEVSAVSKSG